MTPSPRPTIGRIVWYTDLDGSFIPAIVTEVGELGFRVTAFQPSGVVMSRLCTEEGTEPGQWQWPPKA